MRSVPELPVTKILVNPLEAAHHIHEELQRLGIDDMKRVSLSELNGGHRRTHPYQFRDLVRKSETVGDLVTAYQKYASSTGAHDGLTEMDWNKINAAKNCKVKLTDVPAVG